MTTDRPDIPKRLAAQIRGAQDRLRLAQIGVIDCENRISEDQARLSEYEIDPSAFAARHYGKNSKNSYPVQTNIERCREKLSYYTANYDRRIARQKIAEFQLITLERSIYIQVLAMKPSTGRVPWPTQIPNLDSARVHHNEYIKQLLKESHLKREAEKIEQEKESRETEREFRESVSQLIEVIRSEVRSGSISKEQVKNFAREFFNVDIPLDSKIFR